MGVLAVSCGNDIAVVLILVIIDFFNWFFAGLIVCFVAVAFFAILLNIIC